MNYYIISIFSNHTATGSFSITILSSLDDEESMINMRYFNSPITDVLEKM